MNTDKRTAHAYGDSDSDTEAQSRARTRPSALLFLCGLAAMVVAVAAMIGQEAITAVTNVEFRWIFVIVAIVVGVALLFGPSRKDRP